MDVSATNMILKFNRWCENKGVKNTFANYIWWKANVMNKKGGNNMNYYLCVDNFNGRLPLTIGKIYTSTRETENSIWVISDTELEVGYTRYTYFRKVEFIDSDNENFQMRDVTTGELLAYLTKNKEK